MRNNNPATVIIKSAILLVWILFSIGLFGQTKRVLFLGNSYTQRNNLPEILLGAAASAGKTLIYDMYAPGGYYVSEHLTDPISLLKIADGNWDHVVLQDQSMAMAYPNRYLNWMPYYIQIDNIIKANNLCAQTILLSTWGRKNGDSYICSPPMCDTETEIVRTYHQMDTDIELNYKAIAGQIQSSVTPVGATWRYIRQNYPSIELFESDESHPSTAGTYAAACAFYAVIFRSDPTAIAFDGLIPADEAANIRIAAKQIVYNHLLDWNVGRYDALLNDTCSNLEIDPHELNYCSIAPNPVTDVLHVRFSQASVEDTIKLYSIHGILIREIEITQDTTIDFTELPSGFYILQSMNDQQTFKIIKY